MKAMDAVTAHEVVRDLGTLVARDKLSHGTQFPVAGYRPVAPNLLARAGRAIKRFLAGRQLASELSSMPPHLVRDLGLDPDNLGASINARLEQLMDERDALKRRSTLSA